MAPDQAPRKVADAAVGHRRRRVHRCQLRPQHGSGPPRRRGHGAGRADLRGQPGVAGRPGRRRSGSSREISPTRRWSIGLVGRVRRGGALRGRDPRRQLAGRPGPVPAQQRRRHLLGAGGGSPARGPAASHLHRRGLRRPAPGRGRPRSPSRTPYNPSSPYSATKAVGRSAGARLGAVLSACRRRSRTAPTTTGRYQHIEKFIPRQITNVLTGRRPKLYGAGANVRDWIHVDDHNSAVWRILEDGDRGPHLPHRRRRRARQPLGAAADPAADGSRPRRLRPRHRPGRPRPALRDRLDARCATNSAGHPSTPTSPRVCAPPSSGTATTSGGGLR